MGLRLILINLELDKYKARSLIFSSLKVSRCSKSAFTKTRAELKMALSSVSVHSSSSNNLNSIVAPSKMPALSNSN